MQTIGSNTAVIEIGPLKISFPMNDPHIASLSEPEPTSTTRCGLSVPEVGAYWEGQGGIYVGVMPGIDGGPDYHLIASIDEGVDLEWGQSDKRIEGADSKRDGSANTLALLGSGYPHPAAAWASKYTKDGHSDFYLPAQRELNLCYATCAEKFEKDWYWTSTQSSAGWAWCQSFYGGDPSSCLQDNRLRARAVRRLSI